MKEHYESHKAKVFRITTHKSIMNLIILQKNINFVYNQLYRKLINQATIKHLTPKINQKCC